MRGDLMSLILLASPRRPVPRWSRIVADSPFKRPVAPAERPLLSGSDEPRTIAFDDDPPQDTALTSVVVAMRAVPRRAVVDDQWSSVDLESPEGCLRPEIWP